MEKWRSALCNINDTIETVLRKIDTAGTQMSFVVEEDGTLLGIASDGDIRRGLLRGKDLKSLVSEIMTKDPITAQLSQSKNDVRALFEKHKLSIIPVIDGNCKIVDVLTINALLEQPRYSNPIVIMAGGLGSRLLPLTKDRPKPLIEIGGKPILETIIYSAAEQGFTDFILSIGYKGEMIQRYFGDGESFNVRIQYLNEKQSLGTAGSLSLIEEPPVEDFLVMNGDVLNRVNLVNLLENHKKLDHLLTIAARVYETQIPYGVIEKTGTRLTRIVEKPTLHHLINTGIYVCRPEVLNYCHKNESLAMTDLLTRLVNNGHSVGVFETTSYWVDIGQFDELARAQVEWGGR